jgi:hypothetical protein
MLRSFGKSLVVVLACAASGCTASCCYDCIDDTVTGCHDQLEAKMAWRRCKGCFCEVEYYSDFRDGFIAGYIHVMNGGGCCRPTLPPRKYWSLCTRGCDNNCRVVAWYNGWDSGVAQALRDGMGTGPIVTAADIYHTNHRIPVELPEDLRRANVDEDLPGQGLEMLPQGEEFFPEEGNLEQEAPEIPPAAAPYNPPANPAPGVLLPMRNVNAKVLFDDSLTPPAPPRAD